MLHLMIEFLAYPHISTQTCGNYLFLGMQYLAHFESSVLMIHCSLRSLHVAFAFPTDLLPDLINGG